MQPYFEHERPSAQTAPVAGQVSPGPVPALPAAPPSSAPPGPRPDSPAIPAGELPPAALPAAPPLEGVPAVPPLDDVPALLPLAPPFPTPPRPAPFEPPLAPPPLVPAPPRPPAPESSAERSLPQETSSPSRQHPWRAHIFRMPAPFYARFHPPVPSIPRHRMLGCRRGGCFPPFSPSRALRLRLLPRPLRQNRLLPLSLERGLLLSQRPRSSSNRVLLPRLRRTTRRQRTSSRPGRTTRRATSSLPRRTIRREIRLRWRMQPLG